MKTCSKCHIEKDESEFNIRTDRKTMRLSSHCKDCNYIRIKKWRKKNKNKVRGYHSKYKANHRDVVKKSNNKYYEKNKVSISSRSKINNKRYRDELREPYIIKKLMRIGVKKEIINSELIEIKTLLIKIKRHVKENKKVNKQPTRAEI